jgi:hypothetical protein
MVAKHKLVQTVTSLHIAAAGNFRVVGLSTDVDNSDYTVANAAIQVKINLHSLTDTTGI